MTESLFSGIWTTMPSALGNHLWQSTVFVVVAWLLTLLWHQHQARARYWLWLAASLKFLLPFSLLVSLGSRLAPPRAAAVTQVRLYWVVEEVTRPFTQPRPLLLAHSVSPQVASGRSDLVLMALSAIWLSGMAGSLLLWCVRWRRISAALRDAAPLRAGREVEALRRLEKKVGAKRPLAVLQCRSSLEPGILGIFRPMLLWPAGISARLEDAHLEAILAHELWHVRRRDNLAATVHMLVEAVFWFHPVVWWVGARLVEERERACDEEVLVLGSQPQVYAESILKTCAFCVEAPLACMSGVTGADLKTRILRIMTEHGARKLDFSRKLLLATAAALTLTVPVFFGLLNATRVRAQSPAQSAPGAKFEYEVTSIKANKSGEGITKFFYSPDGLDATNVSLRMLIQHAYGIEEQQLAGAPSWLDSERYDVNAKMDPSVADQLRKLDPEEGRTARQKMLQSLLADRLKLVIHRDSKELPIYALAVAKNGPKLQEAKPGDTYPNGIKGPNGVGAAGMMRMGYGELTAQGVPIISMVRSLTMQLHRTVIDQTGLTGKYDFSLHWTPDDGALSVKDGAGSLPAGSSAASDSSGPSIFTAIQEQLGLKLESKKGPVEIVVIDHVERPSPN